MAEDEIDVALSKARTTLAEWQPPEAFVRNVEEVGGLIESALLFNKSNVNFLLDAMALAEFIKLRPAEMVRLAGSREQWPDGFTGTPRAFTPVEITEVMEPGRKRGDEYRRANQNKEPEPDRPADWRARAEKIPEALEDAIKKKVAKRYGSKPVLLVYLNISDYGLMQQETKAAIARLKKQYAGAFQEICVLWQDALY
jgi:hypothetical protein